jgi:hypothetical protein
MGLGVTRRQAMAALGASALSAREARPQAAAEKNGGPKAGVAQAPRTTPLICAFSQNLVKVPYSELGLVAQQIGYDGVDLTVMDGGHVNPHITNVDLVRAIEPPTRYSRSRDTRRCISIEWVSGRMPQPRTQL